MQREIPGWEKETQGVRLLGRALDLQAVQLAATHPAARSHPIEVRPFENE